MAEQKVYIGSVGPMLYEDTDLLDDPDGDLSGATKQGITTTGGAYFGNGVVTASIDLLDTNASNTLSLIWNENDTVDRTLNLLVSGANRSLTLSGDSEIDQDLATTSTPTFVDLILSSPTYTMFNLSDPGVTQVPQWNYSTSSWEWVSAGVTDLSAFTTDDLTEGVSNLYFPGFTDLSTDYGFTDNSSNWNTAYGWGDHTSAGYLTAASTGVTGDWTINSDLGDVTSKLIFGRTTGGNGEISYNGTQISTNKIFNPNGNTYGDPGTYPNKIALWQSGNNNYFGFGISNNALDYFSQSNHRWHVGYNGSPGFEAMALNDSGQLLINTTSAIGSEKLRVNGDIYADGAIKSASDITINADLGNVTSKLIFGRTTGGNGEISWNGTDIGINKYTTVTVADGQVGMRLIGDTGRLKIYPYFDSTYGVALEAMLTSESSPPYYIPMTFSSTKFIFYKGQVLINADSAIGSEKLRVNGDVYIDNDVSADSFIDHTPFYEGDALAEIMKIKGKDGEIDHSTLPAFVHVDLGEDYSYDRETKTFSVKQLNGRSIGGSISMLNTAVVQLYKEMQTLKKGVEYGRS